MWKIENRGKNYPPIHPNDRCTTVAVFDDEITEELQRRARDENGNSILVPQDINYREWKEKYIDKKDVNYRDITNTIKNTKEYKVIEQQYYMGNDGTRYNVDGKNVVLEPSKREKEVANILGRIFGGQVNIIPRINEHAGVKTPDYIVNNKKYDLKEPSGKSKNVLYNMIIKKKEQSDNFIFDLTKTPLTSEELIEQAQKLYLSSHMKFINEIILIRNEKVLKILRRK